ncbi:50S ribosomal protein L31 type B (fragment) [Capnocytophaga canimorsus]
MLAFRKQNEGFMAFGEGLKVGMGVAVIGGLIVAVYTFIFMNYIEPDFAQKILEIEMQKTLEANPQMTQEQMDMAQKISSKFAQTWIITAISFVGSLFFGFIVSLVASAVLQKKRPDTF